ncbi:hypothetical protein JL722_9051 [Aureococcus anophagefferens]|nr:hypothetical protein JL722_9051 [Aureococcus anophagefferens]
MKFVVAPLLVVAMGNSLSDVAAETAANASFPLADVTTLDAPLALRITGSGAADGRYLLREGVPVAGLRCAKRDGVYWENEANAYVLEARDGSATKCVDAARADCYYETRHYETWNSPWGSFGIATKVVESKYLVCGIDKEARLFTSTVGREVHQGKKGDEQPRAFFAGELCAANDEPSAAACVDALCSGEPAEGRGTCPGRDDRSVRGHTDKKSKGVSQLTITVITALFVAGLFLAAATRASCSLRVAEHRRRQKIHPRREDEHPVYPSLERPRSVEAGPRRRRLGSAADSRGPDGVLWRNGDAVIEGTDEAWRIAANGVWYFEARPATRPWSGPSPPRARTGSGSAPDATRRDGVGREPEEDAYGEPLVTPVVTTARADCYYETRQYETWSWGASTKVRETTYKVCGIDAALFAARETLESAGRGSDDERLFGDLCAATDEASAAACVAALCSAEPSEGESSCPEIQHPPDAIVVTKRKTKDRSMTAAGRTASLVLAGLFVMFAAPIVRLRVHELHRIKKVQPLGFTVEHDPSLEAGRIGSWPWRARARASPLDARHIAVVGAVRDRAAARGDAV